MQNENARIAVVAVGGNALIKDVSRQSIPDQYAAACEAMQHVVDMIQEGWEIVLTHGNGPQVGFIHRRSELAAHEVHPVPLDHCGAQSQGAIGYMFQQALYNEFQQRRIVKRVATVITQTLVDNNDPAFRAPTKPIGSFMDRETALRHQREDGWIVVEDAGRGWRRVVASPQPLRIIEAEVIASLLSDDVVVISTGGGGLPVVEDTNGNLTGVEAVIDKDFAASLLATSIGAEIFVISTAIRKVATNFNSPNQRWIDKMSLRDAKRLCAEGHFAPGSMRPKIEAVIRYLEDGGKQAVITTPDLIGAALQGDEGTHVYP